MKKKAGPQHRLPLLGPALVLFALLYHPACFAISWQDLWLRPDQQGAKSLVAGKPDLAASQFKDPNWIAIAQYRAGHYKQAIDTLSLLQHAQAHYNQGNAFAQLGQYDAAIAAYQQTLKLEPHHQDARYNLELVKKLKNNKEKDQQQQSQKQASRQNNPNQKSGKQQQESTSKSPLKQPPSQSQENPMGNSSPPPKLDKKQKKDQAQRKADQAWLRQIPDEPGGLLRQKFLRDYAREQNQNRGLLQ